MTKTLRLAYEVRNPSIPDMTLPAQIEAGCNDWAVEGKSGHVYYGETAAKAIANAAAFNFA